MYPHSRDRREYRYRIETSDTKASSISIGISSGLSEVSVSVSVSVQGFLKSRYQSRYHIIDFSTKLQGNFMPLCSESIGISINIGDLTGISINISISLGICKVSVSVSIQGYPKYQYQSRYQLRAAQSISISIVSKNLVPSVSGRNLLFSKSSYMCDSEYFVLPWVTVSASCPAVTF